MISARPQNAGLRDVYVVWLLFLLTTIAVFATYWRLPPSVLWKVHNTGFIGAAGRAYVFLSFSAALAAIGMLPIVVDRLEDRSADLAGLVAHNSFVHAYVELGFLGGTFFFGCFLFAGLAGRRERLLSALADLEGDGVRRAGAK